MEERIGPVATDDDDDEGPATPARANHTQYARSMQTLSELQEEWKWQGKPAKPEDVAALHLAIAFGEIDLYAAANGGLEPHIYNVWDYATRERVEVPDWLARQAIQ